MRPDKNAERYSAGVLARGLLISARYLVKRRAVHFGELHLCRVVVNLIIRSRREAEDERVRGSENAAFVRSARARSENAPHENAVLGSRVARTCKSTT